MKKIKCIEREGFVTYYGTDKCVLVPETIIEKKLETRGVWFSTVGNIDIQPCDNVSDFKKQMDKVLDKCQEYHLNTVIFQVRPTCDALYSSDINPWSNVLNNEHTEDVNPGFDLFGYFVDEANKRDIEVHAWMNPYRVRGSKLSDLSLTKEEFLEKYLSPKNFARKHPECVIAASDTKLILDPSSDVVQKYLEDTVLEIASKYNIKAIHIDDYFYPYEPIADPDEEEKRLKKYPDLSINDFRRQNVNDMIYKIYQVLQSLPKKVEFGISPFSIYRTNSKWFKDASKEGGCDFGSNNHHTCLEGYESLYADVYMWMEKGWIDYVVPQIYFAFDNFKKLEDGREMDIVKYADLIEWWDWASKKTNVKCYIGQAMYRYNDKGNWSNPEEMIDQIKFNSLYEKIDGSIMFTYKNFVENKYPSLIEARELLKKIWTKDSKPL